jgi:hypothetical protein
MSHERMTHEELWELAERIRSVSTHPLHSMAERYGASDKQWVLANTPDFKPQVSTPTTTSDDHEG